MSRTTIRAAVQTAVVTSTAVASRAYIGRRDAIPEGSLPAACIYLDNEEIEPIAHTATTRRLQRDATVIVEVYAQETSSASCEARLDALTDLIEDIVTADPTLGGVAKDCLPTSVAYEIGAEGSPVTGIARCEYIVVYESTEGS